MNSQRLPSFSALRAFEAAARHQSAKLAAVELSVTPTAISHQIRQLEDIMGVPLFVRRPRQLVLTAQGAELQQVLQTAFTNIGTVVARIQAAPERHAITLSTTPAVAARWLLPWVCILRDAQPRLDLRIHASHAPVALDGVTADMAIRYGKGQWPGLVAEKLFDNNFIPTCSPELKLDKSDDLGRHSLIHFEPQQGFSVGWTQWQKQAQVPGLNTSAGFTFSDETHTITAALDGQGVALMSEALIADELRSGRLVQPFGPRLRGEPFYLVYPEERKHEPMIQAVRDWVTNLPRQR